MDVKYVEPPPIRLSTFIESQNNSDEENREADSEAACPERTGSTKNIPRPSTTTSSNSRPHETKQKRYSSMPAIGINTNTPSRRPNLNVKGLRFPVVPLRPPRSPSFSPLDDIFDHEVNERIHTRISSDRVSPVLKLAQRFNSAEAPASPASESPPLLVPRNYYENKLLRKNTCISPKNNIPTKLESNLSPGIRTTSLPLCHIQGFATNRTAAAKLNTRSISIASISITQGFKVAAEANSSRKHLYSHTFGVLANLSKKTTWNVSQQKQNLKRHSSSISLGGSRTGKQIAVWGSRKSKKRAHVNNEGRFQKTGETNDPGVETSEIEFKSPRSIHSKQPSDASFTDIFGHQEDEDMGEMPTSKAKAESEVGVKDSLLLSSDVTGFSASAKKTGEKDGLGRGFSKKFGVRVDSHSPSLSNVIKAVAGRLWKVLAEKTKDGRPVMSTKLISWEQGAVPTSALALASNRNSIGHFNSIDKSPLDETMALNYDSSFENIDRSWTPIASSSLYLQNESDCENMANTLNEFDTEVANDLAERSEDAKLDECAPSTVKSGSPVKVLKPKHRPSSIYNSFSAFAKAHCLDDSAIAALLYLVIEDQDD